MTDFGSGPKLNRNLDFEVTETGDLRTVSGIEELEKDIGLQSLISMTVFIGRVQNNQTKAKIRSRVSDVLLADPRIENVESIDVTFISTDNEVEIVATISSDNTEQELVFEV